VLKLRFLLLEHTKVTATAVAAYYLYPSSFHAVVIDPSLAVLVLSLSKPIYEKRFTLHYVFDPIYTSFDTLLVIDSWAQSQPLYVKVHASTTVTVARRFTPLLFVLF
jgi:hypothetical protein